LHVPIPESAGGFPLLGEVALAAWLTASAVGLLWRHRAGRLLPGLTGLGALLLLLAALVGGNGGLDLPLPWSLGDARLQLVADPLSRWFLAVIALVALPVVLFTPGYLQHLRDRVSLGLVWSMLALLLASMAGVVLAGNALVFLVAWELMALSSYALVAADHGQRGIRQAAFTYLGATRVGTALLMAGFLWIHQLTGSWTFAEWHLRDAAALGPGLLILAGLAVKAGCWPFHLWLPIAHPGCAGPGLRRHERRHDQDRDLCHGPAVRPGRPPLRSGLWPRPAGAGRRLRPVGRALRAPAA
jgi:hydrogenase-4 component B